MKASLLVRKGRSRTSRSHKTTNSSIPESIPQSSKTLSVCVSRRSLVEFKRLNDSDSKSMGLHRPNSQGLLCNHRSGFSTWRETSSFLINAILLYLISSNKSSYERRHDRKIHSCCPWTPAKAISSKPHRPPFDSGSSDQWITKDTIKYTHYYIIIYAFIEQRA